jgi:DNA-binding NtrC family response regulator
VRALRHACERAVILGSGADYALADFGLPGVAGDVAGPGGLAGAAGAAAAASQAPPGGAPALSPRLASDDLTLSALERDAIAAALAASNGNISHTARMLGVSRAALYRKLGKHGI